MRGEERDIPIRLLLFRLLKSKKWHFAYSFEKNLQQFLSTIENHKDVYQVYLSQNISRYTCHRICPTFLDMIPYITGDVICYRLAHSGFEQE